MSPSLPPWAAPLEAETKKNPDAGFRWLAPEALPEVTNVLLGAADESPFGGEAREEGRARIRRSVPLATGPSRPVRLTQHEVPSVLLFDPGSPDLVWATLGAGFPPQLWPSAEPTLAGIQRDLGVYLGESFKSRAELRRSLRVRKGTLEGLGFETLDDFAQLVGRIESWLDSKATWGSASDDDPWPDDPRTTPMIVLRTIAQRASEQHPARARSITMRTLWSRSLLTIELGAYDTILFEMRYDPAPFVTRLPAGDGHLLVPEDLPVDLLACLIRGGTTTMESLSAVMGDGPTPAIAETHAVLAPAESTTYELIRQLIADPEHRRDGAAIASDLGARGLVYEAALAEQDPEARAEMLSWIALGPPEPRDEDDESEDDLDDEDEDEDGDEDEDEDEEDKS